MGRRGITPGARIIDTIPVQGRAVGGSIVGAPAAAQFLMQLFNPLLSELVMIPAHMIVYVTRAAGTASDDILIDTFTTQTKISAGTGSLTANFIDSEQGGSVVGALGYNNSGATSGDQLSGAAVPIHDGTTGPAVAVYRVPIAPHIVIPEDRGFTVHVSTPGLADTFVSRAELVWWEVSAASALLI